MPKSGYSLYVISSHCCLLPTFLSPFLLIIILFSSFNTLYRFSPPIPHFSPWISMSFTRNYTSVLLSRLLDSPRCNHSLTSDISLPYTPTTLPSSEITILTFHALDEFGERRCVGGDYFETDLSSPSWKSRPPVTDHGNGTYSIHLQVHTGFVGMFIAMWFYLSWNYAKVVILPVRCGQAAGLATQKAVIVKLMSKADTGVSPLISHACSHGAMAHGPLGLLESSGWVYSAHCSFRIFTQETAWQCLDKKWLFFWGDSNHVDTVQNLLYFVLGLTNITSVQRRFDQNFTSPNGFWSVRITNVFNGHWNETSNYLGLDSFKSKEYRKLLRGYYFGEDSVLDVAVFNSGLHDGVRFGTVDSFAQAAERAVRFWHKVMRHVDARGKRRPRIFYRTTVAGGARARDLAFNPHKMEVYNGIMIEMMQKKGLLRGGGGVVDQFDMSFPWHYNNRYSDGLHYGRFPAKARWVDGEIGHHYFGDLMLCHVLLNAICNE